MPVSINGNTGVITGLAVGGLPDGTIDADSLASNAVTSAKLASGVGGKLLQVVTGVALGTASNNSTTFAEITTDLRCTITPISASSKIIVTANLSVAESGGLIAIRILKDGTTMVNTPTGFVSSELEGNACSVVNSANNMFPITVQVIETAGSTSSRYYTPFWASVSGTAWFNRWSTVTFTETTSTMTVMEVAA